MFPCLWKSKTSSIHVRIRRESWELVSRTSIRWGFRCARRRRWGTHLWAATRTGNSPICTHCLSDIPATPRTSPIVARIFASSSPPSTSLSPVEFPSWLGLDSLCVFGERYSLSLQSLSLRFYSSAKNLPDLNSPTDLWGPSPERSWSIISFNFWALSIYSLYPTRSGVWAN